MALAEKVFEAKLINVKNQVDGLLGMVRRKRLSQTDAIDELSCIVLEVSQAVQATEEH